MWCAVALMDLGYRLYYIAIASNDLLGMVGRFVLHGSKILYDAPWWEIDMKDVAPLANLCKP
jgi:hypothetical protein